MAGTESRRRRWAIVAAMAAALLAAPAGAQAVSLDQTCELAAGYNDPSIRNVGFPDEAAGYWVAAYVAAPGTRLRIQGRFPHARYMSFNAYDAAARPIDSLSDIELAPDAGSVNPFRDGANRQAAQRSYTATVELGPRPALRAPNTLYAGGGQGGAPNVAGTLLYRLYLPDDGTGNLGGEPLPELTLETPGGSDTPIRLVDCSTLSPPRAGLTDDLARLSPPVRTGLRWPGYDPPLWRRFVNLPTAYADLARDNPYADKTPLRALMAPLPLATLGGAGGFFSNRDNDYIYATVSRGWGKVLVLTGRAPTFPDTRRGARAMPARSDVRYFSLCQNEVLTTRWISCLTDDHVAVGRDGRYRIAISTAADRPRNARAACGVTWMPWGPFEWGVLIMRHMLPDPGFASAIQRIPRDATAQDVAGTMGPYYPAGRYYRTRSAFEALGCRGRRNPPSTRSTGAKSTHPT